MLENQSLGSLAILLQQAEGLPQHADRSAEILPRGLSTVDKLGVGTAASVVRVAARCPELRQKLLSLGVVAGTRLEVTAIAPLGDPINIRLLGFTLSLRLCEANCISVRVG